MQLYFVRHGQSENNRMWSRTGTSEERVSDPKLTGTGERQAVLVAQFLAAPAKVVRDDATRGWDPQNLEGFPITHCYTSLMERAVATGHEIAEVLDLPLLSWIDIHETGGMFLRDPETEEYVGKPGLSRSYLERTFPRLILPDTVTEEGWWNRPFEPEDVRQKRADGVLEALLARHGETDDAVVFVSHGGFFNHLLRAVLGIGELDDDRLWFSANNASVTRIDFVEGRRLVEYVNRVDFLPPDLIT
jgi:2,3-bisphosphoglycerate-dependent phosphoglycerate mutase